jgi:RecB family exonuclease/inactivated superfamily I helicase
MMPVNDLPIERIFLGLAAPPLQTASAKLLQRYQESIDGKSTIDLSEVLVVLPTLRSSRRFLQLLVDAAGQQQSSFTPPQIITIGDLPEHLYVAQKELASDLAQQIAWTKALEQTPTEIIEQLSGVESNPNDDRNRDWQPLAQLMVRLHTRLASDIWSFRSVAREVKKLKNFLSNELQRWEALETIQQTYYEILDSVNLWDPQAARSFAAAGYRLGQQRCHCSKDILLIGVADLNRSLIGMLSQVADKVTCMVAAEQSMSDRFDAMGGLIAQSWTDATISIHDANLLIVNKPIDQAHAVLHYLEHLPGDTAICTDEITVGVPDAKVIPQIERELSSAGLPHRNLAGKPLDETPPVRLMTACRDYLRTQDYASFASLLRHPDLFSWITNQIQNDQFLADFDAYQNAHLPDKILVSQHNPFGDPDDIASTFDTKDPNSQRRATKNAQQCRQLNEIHGLIAPLLLPMSKGVRPLGQWAKHWTEVLATVYGDRILDRTDQGDRQTIAACVAIGNALAIQQQVPEGFGIQTTAAQALQWSLDAASEQRVLPNPKPDAIEIAGWLDLALDDAPVLVVTGMNDDSVPTSEVGHQFLPNALCEQLGILDNNRRYARDCYALTVMTAVRENYLLITGRSDHSGEPKKPSRLLFADSPDVAAARARAFFTFVDNEPSELWLGDKTSIVDSQQLQIPYPVCDAIPDRLSVTKFKEYLKCPYRFYLNIVMNLRTASDDWRELSGGTFGDLAHNVLEAFAESELRDSTRVEAIAEFLSQELDAQSRKIFLGSRLPAVQFQMEQLRLRLQRFAICQAEHRKSGWQIVSTEELLAHELEVDGEVFTVTGKIDRVDRHEETHQIAIWDYKTSDKGEGPKQAHRKSKQWQDLQLPLYRHLVKEVDVVKNDNLATVKLGYVLLSRDLDQIRFEEADFDAEMLAEADELVFDCIRKIRKGIFWPPVAKPPPFSEDFAAICQDNVFQQFDIAQNTPSEMAVQPKDTVVELPW